MSRLPKKPKAPKAGASMETWKNYDRRLTEHQKKVAQIKRDRQSKKSLIAKTRKKASSM